MKDVLSLRADLRCHAFEDDLLVYDPQEDRVHLLNKAAATVFTLLQAGSPLTEIEAQLTRESSYGADVLSIALDQLRTADFFVGNFASPSFDPSRREALQKIAAVGLGIVLPAIFTLAPSASYAQGGSLGLGAACSASGQCASGCCQQGQETGCNNNTCVNPATSCSKCRN